MADRRSELTADRVRSILDYNPETGVFIWRVASRRKPAGSVAGGTSGPSRYIDIYIDGVAYKAHRLAWLYVHGEWPQHTIDHVNRIKSDNRIANLRDVSLTDNLQNRVSTWASTGLRGVSKSRDKYLARIRVGGKLHYLGLYKTAEEAAQARNVAEQRLHPLSPLARQNP
jgi:hypothetical protein